MTSDLLEIDRAASVEAEFGLAAKAHVVLQRYGDASEGQVGEECKQVLMAGLRTDARFSAAPTNASLER